MYRVWNFVTNYSILLILGASIALVWANIDADSYHHFVEFELIHDSSERERKGLALRTAGLATRTITN